MVTKAKVGDKFVIKFIEDPFNHKLPKKFWKSGEVAVSCNEDSPGIGRWVCLTHNKVFGNQMNKDGHIFKGDHQLAWWCPKCVTYETP